MNHRRPVAVLASVLILTAVHSARSQIGSNLPFNPTATSVTSQVGAVRDYVRAGVAKLSNTDRQVVAEGRRELLRGIEQPGVVPSPAFVDLYATTVAQEIASLVDSKDVFTRLNAAIVIEKAASLDKSLKLADLIGKLVADESEAVALWGVRAAGPVLPAAIDANKPLAAAVVATAKKFPDQPVITAEAYNALTATPPDAPNMKPATVSKLVEAICDLVAFRLERFAAGEPVSDLASDERGTSYIINFKAWPSLNGAQQRKALELSGRMIDLAFNQMGLLPDPASADRIAADEYRGVLSKVGGSVSVIGQILQQSGNATGESLMNDARKLTRISAFTTPASLAADVAALKASLARTIASIRP